MVRQTTIAIEITDGVAAETLSAWVPVAKRSALALEGSQEMVSNAQQVRHRKIQRSRKALAETRFFSTKQPFLIPLSLITATVLVKFV